VVPKLRTLAHPEQRANRKLSTTDSQQRGPEVGLEQILPKPAAGYSSFATAGTDSSWNRLEPVGLRADPFCRYRRLGIASILRSNLTGSRVPPWGGIQADFAAPVFETGFVAEIIRCSSN
jgi:hypothetical protein